MKEKTKKRIQGSISILLIIILVPMMTLAAVVVDTARINMAKSMISSAGDLTMNTALANYDTILKDVYGLFAMSQSETNEELAKSLQGYFEDTLVSYGVVSQDEAGDYVSQLLGDFNTIIANVGEETSVSTSGDNVTNFLAMDVGELTATKVSGSSLADAGILRSQIVEYMKYRAPVNFGLSFLDSITAFKNVQSQSAVVEKQVVVQESTQDVTSACQTLIADIRAYDKLVASIEEAGGDKNVVGKDTSKDENLVEIEEYDSQVEKYAAAWGGVNYTHLNQLNLIFQGNTPGVNSVYLKGQNYTGSVYFIKTDASGLVYDNSGISVTVNTAGTTDEAEGQVRTQVNTISSSAQAKKLAAYQAMLPTGGILSSSYKSFKDETSAISNFLKFEKFLTDDSSSSVLYSDIKTALEQIYTLGKYYDNFCTKIDADISAAKEKSSASANAASSVESSASSTASDIQSKVTKINNNMTDISNAKDNYAFLTGILNSDGEDLNSVILAMSAQSKSMPGTKTISGKSFYDFSGYTDGFKEKSGDSVDQYQKVFQEIITSSLANDATYANICLSANTYLSDLADNKTDLSFSDYMKQALGDDVTNQSLYVLLVKLYSSHNCVSSIKSYIADYDSTIGTYSTKKQQADADKAEQTSLENQKTSVTTVYKSCLSSHSGGAAAYQADVYNYTKYIETAQNVMKKEATAIYKQVTLIESNIKALIDQLDVILVDLETTRKSIKTYKKNVDNWETENKNYTTETGGDSFSQQTESDIDTANSEYNLDSLDTLKIIVEEEQKEYQSFYDFLSDSASLKYGSAKIDTIKTADDLSSASASVKSSLSTIVTAEEADRLFAQLYNNGETPDFYLSGQYYFLEPIRPIQFLKYLNEAYPETAPETIGSNSQTSEAVKSDYERTKANLTSDSGKSVDEESTSTDSEKSTTTSSYGYTYGSLSVSGDLPSSKKTSSTEVSTNQLSISETGDGKSSSKKVDVSSGVSSQKGTLNTILSGLGSVAETALENVYILDYIMENFSYNTIVQDAIVEGEDISTYADALGGYTDELVTQYSSQLESLSSYPINGSNNYIYGAEVEYILFGNATASKNVTYTKASIYAIRFAFNCIYAFTNSEIRNTTMSVGLAVQAATCGFVPYQLVQIVLELALAAAESAFDLNAMSLGLDVVVVKSSETWVCSVTGATRMASDVVTNVATKVTENAIKYGVTGLQALVDAGVDQVTRTVEQVSDDLTSATKSKLEGVIDDAFSVIESKVTSALNDLQYTIGEDNPTQAVNNAFDGLTEEIKAELESRFGGNELASKILPKIEDYISTIVEGVKTKVTDVVKEADSECVGDKLVKSMTEIKLSLVSKLDDALNGVSAKVSDIVSEVTGTVAEELKNSIKEAGDNITEEVSETIKEKVNTATNNFIDQYLSDGVDSTIGSGDATGATSSSVASVIKFGYKEYLMLLLYIKICTSDDAILRTGDLIQKNIQTASSGGSYKHKKGESFSLSNAYTYISIDETVSLKMLFLNMDFFTQLLDDGETDVEGDLSATATIHYKGLRGY